MVAHSFSKKQLSKKHVLFKKRLKLSKKCVILSNKNSMKGETYETDSLYK